MNKTKARRCGYEQGLKAVRDTPFHAVRSRRATAALEPYERAEAGFIAGLKRLGMVHHRIAVLAEAFRIGGVQGMAQQLQEDDRNAGH